MSKVGNSHSKLDIDRYLSEPNEKHDVDFDILNWWKVNSSRFEVLSHMARDSLAILISTVASESVFGTSGRIIDLFRSALAPKTVEALIYAQNWLLSKPTQVDLNESFNEIVSTEQERVNVMEESQSTIIMI